MEHNQAIEKLNLLEKRISRTAERFSHLKEQYEALQHQKTTLERELDELRSANDELNGRIHNLKLNKGVHQNSFNREEVRKRIDRVLEKFGELQL
ncbi:MAG: cell division protein ZapB [Candidatus Krumholzibacteriota bacterium]|nr:cell division protein ZapB [Candidatus Krumholzibacteriota bacterium]